MKLYHGTRASLLSKILDQGILPRNKRRSCWEHAPSHPSVVYLTDAYAPYFAAAAACDKEGEKLGLVVEIDSNRLDHSKLLPDEDALEQTNRGRDKVEGDMFQRNKHYRSIMSQYCNGEWETSLKVMGTCGHLGKIAPATITRVALIPTLYLMMWDASVGVMNYRWLGPKYRAQMARLFGDVPVDPPTEPFGDWQVPLSGHDVHIIVDGKLGPTTRLQFPDERQGWKAMREKLQQRNKENTS